MNNTNPIIKILCRFGAVAGTVEPTSFHGIMFTTVAPVEKGAALLPLIAPGKECLYLVRVHTSVPLLAPDFAGALLTVGRWGVARVSSQGGYYSAERLEGSDLDFALGVQRRYNDLITLVGGEREDLTHRAEATIWPERYPWPREDESATDYGS